MASQIPASLKAADIGRFVTRAAQLMQAEPIITYWCNYWIVQQILSKNLQNADNEAMAFTLSTMDKLEKYKNDHATEEAITDDVAGKAVVEQFGLKTFDRADSAVRSDRVTKQTADTFLAAATFFDLLAIWGAIETEYTQKTKYAKFHAIRIVKAIKAGEDPNLSNPKEDLAVSDAPPPLDPNDPEVRMLTGQDRDRQPSVVDVPDEADSLQAGLATQSIINESIHPSRAPSAPLDESAGVSPLPKDAAAFYGSNQADVSPMSPERKSSIGGNYFPRVPSPSAQQTESDIPPLLPSAPDTFSDAEAAFNLPSAPADFDDGPSLPAAPTDFAQPQPLAPKTPLDSFQAPPTPGQPSITSLHPNIPQAPSQPPDVPSLPPALPQQHFTPANLSTSTKSNLPKQAPAVIPPTTALQPSTNPDVVVDEAAMMKAQKHARWAISALNFEDVPTAIREFQLALQTLGAR